LYDGPFCILSLVDNHTFKRLLYEVLDHDPTHEDITRFLRRFRRELDRRELTLRGVTTDGSELYPQPLAEVFPGVVHQICRFHVLQEINRQTLKALATVRRALKQTLPQGKRGRPAAGAARKAARKKRRIEAKISALFEHRHLFVKRTLCPGEKRILGQITRGLPFLRRLRAVVDQVYRLFDRRCRTQTALEKLAQLRRHVRRFRSLGKTLGQLFTPNIEKALIFLDESLLPSTSNAVERSNRRHRKMQKTIYRVRTQAHIAQRIALDMQRDEQAPERFHTTVALHNQRNGASVCR
jgi:hypothetical protein